MRLGNRRLLAATCRRCGHLFQGTAFHYHRRNSRDKADYIDQRCPNCKWGSRVKGKRDAQD